MSAYRVGEAQERAERGKEMLKRGVKWADIATELGYRSRSMIAVYAQELREDEAAAANPTDDLPFEEPGVSVWRPDLTAFERLQEELEHQKRLNEMLRAQLEGAAR